MPLELSGATTLDNIAVKRALLLFTFIRHVPQCSQAEGAVKSPSYSCVLKCAVTRDGVASLFLGERAEPHRLW